jgi:hypothetical protein
MAFCDCAEEAGKRPDKEIIKARITMAFLILNPATLFISHPIPAATFLHAFYQQVPLIAKMMARRRIIKVVAHFLKSICHFPIPLSHLRSFSVALRKYHF